jgi:hypothetical protein
MNHQFNLMLVTGVQIPPSITPEVFEPRRRHLGIARRVLDVLVSEIGLQRTGVDAIIRQLVSGGVPEHVRMDTELEAGCLAGALNQAGEPFCRERRLTFGDEHVFTARRLASQLTLRPQLVALQGMDGRDAVFDALVPHYWRGLHWSFARSNDPVIMDRSFGTDMALSRRADIAPLGFFRP